MNRCNYDEIEQYVHQYRKEQSNPKMKPNIITYHYLLDTLCNKFGFSSVEELKRLELPSIQQFSELEKRINVFISSYVSIRNIVTLHDCRTALLHNEEVENFEDLGIGNCFIWLEPIHHYFPYLPAYMIDVPSITTMNIIQALRSSLQDRRTTNTNVNVRQFLYQVQQHNYPQLGCVEEMGVIVNDLHLEIKMIKHIKLKEQKELKIIEKQFSQDIQDSLFQVTKEKFSVENKEKALKKKQEGGDIGIARHTPPTKLKAIVSCNALNRLTSLDSYLDSVVSRQWDDLPENALRQIVQNDQTIFQFITKTEQRKFSSDSKFVLLARILTSCISKLSAILGKEAVKEEEECLCCCVGKDECNCDCKCQCHVVDDDDSTENGHSPKAPETKESEHDVTKNIPVEMIQNEMKLILQNNPSLNLIDPFMDIEKQVCAKLGISSTIGNGSLSFLTLLSQIIPKKEVPQEITRPIDISRKDVHEFIQQYHFFNVAPSSLKVIEKALLDHFHLPSLHILGFGSMDQFMQPQTSPKNPFLANQSIICSLAQVSKATAITHFHMEEIDVVELILQVPYLVDISQWMDWEHLYYSNHGSLYQFIQRIMKKHSLYVVAYPTSQELYRLDPSSTAAHLLNAGVKNQPLECAIHAFSFYIKERQCFPMALVQNHFKYIFQAIQNIPEFSFQFLSALPLSIGSFFFPLLFKAHPHQHAFYSNLQSKTQIPIKLYVMGLQNGYHDWLEGYKTVLLLTKATIPSDVDVQNNFEPTITMVPMETLEVPSIAVCPISQETDMLKTEQISAIGLDTAQMIIEDIRKNEFGVDVSSRLLTVQHQRLERALLRLSDELYSKDIHFVFELLQNADDNQFAPSRCPSISFHISDKDIIVYTNEIGFTDANIRAICDIGASTKENDPSKIGQKGIGFKSVFKVTDNPQIYSNGFQIEFNAKQKPLGYILPHWITDSKPQFEGNGTYMVLPLKQEKHNIAEILKLFQFIEPCVLLFLKQLQSLTIQNDVKMQSLSYTKTVVADTTQQGFRYQTIELSSTKTQVWNIIQASISIPASLQPLSSYTNVALAFPMDEKDIKRMDVFAFLPIRSYGFKFIIQCNFIVSSSRESIDCNHEWNQWLVSELPALFIQSVRMFQSNKKLNYLSFIPLEQEIEEPFQSIPREINSQLQTINCIPIHDSCEYGVPSEMLFTETLDLMGFLSNDVLKQTIHKQWCHIAVLPYKSKLDSMHIESVTVYHLIQIASALLASNQFQTKSIEWIETYFHYLKKLFFEQQKSSFSTIQPLLESILASTHKPLLKLVFESLNKQWNIDYAQHPLIQKMLHGLRNSAWINSNNNILQAPTSLWLPHPSIRCILPTATFIHPEWIQTPHLNLSLLQIIGISTEISLAKVIDHIIIVSKNKMLPSGLDMENIYHYFFTQSQDSLANRQLIQTSFRDHQLIYTDGFVSSDQVIWSTSEYNTTRFPVLSQSYPFTLKQFFVEMLHIAETPTVSMLLMELESEMDNRLLFFQLLQDLSSMELKEHEVEKILQTIQHLPYFEILGQKQVALQLQPMLNDLLIPANFIDCLFQHQMYVLNPKNIQHIIPLVKRFKIPTISQHMLQHTNTKNWSAVFDQLQSKMSFDENSLFFYSLLKQWIGLELENLEPILSYKLFPTETLQWKKATEIYINDDVYLSQEIIQSNLAIPILKFTDEQCQEVGELLSRCKVLGVRKALDITVKNRPPTPLNSTITPQLQFLLSFAQRFIFSKHHALYDQMDKHRIQHHLKDLQCLPIENGQLLELEIKLDGTIFRLLHSTGIFFDHTQSTLYFQQEDGRNMEEIIYPILLGLCDQLLMLGSIRYNVANFLYLLFMKATANNSDNNISVIEKWCKQQQVLPLPIIEVKWFEAIENSLAAATMGSTEGPLESERKQKKQKIISPMPLMHFNKNTSDYDQFTNCNNAFGCDDIEQRQYIGRWGEEYVYHELCQQYPLYKVDWINQVKETGKPYDIIIHKANHNIDYIEVKSTRTSQKPIFEISINELDSASANGSNFYIYRVFNAGNEQRASLIKIRNPISLIRQGNMQLLLSIDELADEFKGCKH